MKRYIKSIVIVAFSTLLFQANQSNQPAKQDPVKPAETPAVQQVIPATPVVEVPAPVVKKLGCELAYNYDWPQSIAYQICMKESGGNQNAANWGDNHMSWAGCKGSFGLFQINCSHGQVFDPEQNVAIAYSMYKGWGNSFRAWTTCKMVANCY